MTQIETSPAQQAAVDAIRNWHQYNGSGQLFRLFGYAGTGKTTVVAKAVSELGIRAEYAAYTGKAAAVMREQGIPAQTIHRLIYHPKTDPLTRDVKFVRNSESVAKFADLIVIDECSMVGVKVAQDLLSYNTKILALGDPAQLPPVEGAGYFTTGEPDAQLVEIHRQAADSPVLRLATAAREGRKLSYGKIDDSEVVEARDLEDNELWQAEQVLVGTNATREKLNRRARAHFGMTGPFPQMGEKLICLRNNYEYNMMNGEMFIVARAKQNNDHWLSLDLVRMDGQNEVVPNVMVMTRYFLGSKPKPTEPFISGVAMDYAYAITVHKAQGSQWGDVILLDESRVFPEHANRWLYTGITRAANKITIAKGRL